MSVVSESGVEECKLFTTEGGGVGDRSPVRAKLFSSGCVFFVCVFFFFFFFLTSFMYPCHLHVCVNGFVQFTRCCTLSEPACRLHGAFFADTAVRI